MKTSILGPAILVTVLLAAYTCLVSISHKALESSAQKDSSVSSILSETNNTTEFERANALRRFKFPDDHFPHRRFRSEWWYFTGNLTGSNKKDYGFDLTIFRFGLKPTDSPDPSPFKRSQIFLAHFALADVQREQYFSDEKFSREISGVTGVDNNPFSINVENWSITQTDAEKEYWMLKAHNGEFGMNLALKAIRPIVLQGQQGLSQKSSTPGNASYYYSIPKLTVDGNIVIAGQDISVNGAAWFDREWSTSVLERGQIGWDWFGLHIADDMELMFYQIRQANGTYARESHGVLLLDNGEHQIKLGSEVKLTPLAYWTSKNTRARYPVKWRLEAPQQSLDIVIAAKFNDQQWDGAFVYWEGSVTTSGTYQGRRINGEGFLEMTGYDVPTR